MDPDLALGRIALLLNRDFVVDFATYDKPHSCVALRHKSRACRYNIAYVYGSGQVVLSGRGQHERRFYADGDEGDFRTFINSVPLAKWYEQKLLTPSWYAWGAGYAIFIWITNSGLAAVKHLFGY